MKHIKTVSLMEIMTGLDLDQHQRSMDVLLHCQQLVRDVLWCNMSIVLCMGGMYMSLLLFDQSLEGKVKRSLWEKKEYGRIHYDDDDDDVLLWFSQIFFFFFPFFSLFFFSSHLLYPHFYDVYVQDRPIHQTIILHSVELLTKEYCLEIECRPMLRPRSVVNHGSLSIHMLSLVHFHHDIHLNTLLVVVSIWIRKRNKDIEWGVLRVSADDSRGQSLFTHWRVQTITIVFFFFFFILLLLVYFFLHFFLI